MSTKVVALIYGGKSPEHEIAVKSARNIAKAIDSQKYSVILVGIDKQGSWYQKTDEELINEDVVLPNTNPLSVSPGAGDAFLWSKKNNQSIPVDVVFPIIHGAGGEDGSIQGLLTLANIPYVGCGIAASAMCMDKAYTKQMLSENKIKNTPFRVLFSHKKSLDLENIVVELGFPLYVKASSLGSSVGVYKAENKEALEKAIADAFTYDNKILLEKNIQGREIECAVLGNLDPKASALGEAITVKSKHSFYSYQAKYLDANGSYTQIPAKMSPEFTQEIKKIAIDAYAALGCQGLARVDVFLTEDNEILVNEINTMPGFTDISMYPKLWEHEGIPYSELLSKLIDLAFEAFNYKSNVQQIL